MAALTKATVSQACFTTIYDRMVANVTSVTLTDSSTSTIQTYTGAFPDKDIDTKSVYPICVINTPSFKWTDFTFTKKQVEGSFTVDIYTTKAESADLFLDAIIESIETYRATLKSTYNMEWVNLESTDSAHEQRGKMKVHMRSCTFNFKFQFTKTY